ncbi:EAL domain-containing protein [Nocardioides sp. BP30]|uniref:EAL domain-containing protein n=1 Tax=Nocardioides sp. BP30 TaxID=3036374 RepID=UPI002469A91B|nr:EAL domain-containing protein [Nocardioides sp. BP30]WGL51582.1 EAL domain-containing protein [Nocardioides sp. BP30]
MDPELTAAGLPMVAVPRPRAGDQVRLGVDVIRWLLANGGVATAYQPIIDVRRDRVIGWEALLRAQHPEIGAISPVALVEAATEHGLIDALTRRIVEDAWHTMALARDIVAEPLTIHLNLEPAQLGPNQPLLQWIADIAWPEDVRVIAEITERGADRWLPVHELGANTLVSGGLALAIDDCGAGSSRLGFLNSRHWDMVKLDRSLIAESGERAQLVLKHLIEMLAALGTVSLAEGIETIEQYRTARGLGVDEAQGYLLGMPVPGAVMLATLAKNGLALDLDV